MTMVEVVLYAVSAVLELGGVYLVVDEARSRASRRREWDRKVDEEVQQAATSLEYQLIPLVQAYGISPAEIRRASWAADNLLAFRPGRDRLTVALLVGGVLTGLAANLISAVK